MFSRCVATLIIVVIGHMLTVLSARAQETTQSEREAMYYRYWEFASLVKGGSVEPHWMADGSSFWYAEGAPANTVIWKVNPVANSKSRLFDTQRLRDALTKALDHEPPYQGLPFDKFTFVDESEQAIKFTVEDKEFISRLDTYASTRAPAVSEQEKSRLVPRVVRKSPFSGIFADVLEELSPDRRWFAGLKDNNLWLRSTYDGRSVQMTTDGTEDYHWGDVEFEPWWASWSPNSLKLAVKKVDYRHVPKIPILHYLPTEEVEWVHFPRAGQPMRRDELFIVDILPKRWVRIDIGEDPDQYIYLIGWRPDGSELLFLRKTRDHKKLDLMAANPTTGSARVILTETQETFVEVHPVRGWTRLFTLLGDGKRFLWLSERDGWKHLYLYDLDGNLIRRLTEGAFPVERVVVVDEKAGWVYFTAHGDQQRPYDTHLYRVNLDGKGFTQLTEEPGQHAIQWQDGVQFSPSKEFFLETHSSPARPPVVDLRRADGTLLQTVAKANIDGLKELHWSPPEEFVVKATDGKTDLYGVLFKPYDFDPTKKYPVIDWIYAGPHLAMVPRTFTSRRQRFPQALAQLGFIVFVVDGRGTPKRGKEFQDVVYGNVGRHEIPDHVTTLKQLAEKRPYMDLGRVGIAGGSWGGYFAVRALLLAPEVYHVGIASAPPADLSDQWHGDAEIVLGLLQKNKEKYEYASNLRLAGNLKGKLLLIHGTSDVLVPFSQTIKMVEALILAGKPYDLIVLPEQGHGFTGGGVKSYRREAIRRYFQEHLKPEQVVMVSERQAPLK